MSSMTTHPSYKAIVNAVVLTYMLIALFAILLAALLLSLLTYMGAACCAIADEKDIDLGLPAARLAAIIGSNLAVL
jgi:hypothetical protein